MNKVTDSTFEEEVLNSDKPVLLEFSAVWCGPCHMLEPILNEIASENKGLKVVKMDVDENSSWPATMQIMSIPTMILWIDGNPVGKRMVGFRPKSSIIFEVKEELRNAGVTGIGIPI